MNMNKRLIITIYANTHTDIKTIGASNCRDISENEMDHVINYLNNLNTLRKCLRGLIEAMYSGIEDIQMGYFLMVPDRFSMSLSSKPENSLVSSFLETTSGIEHIPSGY